MQTRNVIEGLTILQKYRDKQDGYDLGAEHDVLYAYATDRPVEPADLERLVELGWFQETADYSSDEEYQAKHYTPDEGWTAFV